MTAPLLAQIGMVLLVSALAVLLFSIYRSATGAPSAGLAGLGTVLLVMGIGLRKWARSGR
ncbi:hypothetical protein [Polymorphobacter fuscus]|uniref:Uncharacterized protein n=1 Tax=Sandarakinorhabdus fusca TaxID=1439888 RepID=A0A7C9GNK0_9SPHN|nr:hypothetical protein [Polymorphobacter fuscus]KAB7648732.1 hypothetical protein F9290_03370 [Polymorphobacter fuscus]MQT16296.1 hypothetical protein [Polymorphobacter fuscus]NJC07418.1 putative membrane protein [Polymorphobacter fuscus]